MKLIKSLILVMFVAALSACSFDKNDSIDVSGESQIRERLRKVYDSVAGTYQGTLQVTTGAPQIIKIRLYRLEKDDDSSGSGASRKIPVLVGNYTKVSPIGPGYEFDARYFEGKQELVMTNNATNLNNDDVHTVTGKIVNNHIIGKVITKGGYSGNIDLPLVTRENAGGGDSTEDNEYYDNLRRQYEEIAGLYEGKITTAEGKTFINGTVRLLVENNPHPENPEISVPSLTGKVHDLAENDGTDGAGNPLGMSDLTCTTVYNTKVTPRRLTLYGVPVYGGAANPFRASFEGKIELDPKGNYIFYGTYTQRPASFSGPFLFVRKAGTGPAPTPTPTPTPTPSPAAKRAR